MTSAIESALFAQSRLSSEFFAMGFLTGTARSLFAISTSPTVCKLRAARKDRNWQPPREWSDVIDRRIGCSIATLSPLPAPIPRSLGPSLNCLGRQPCPKSRAREERPLRRRDWDHEPGPRCTSSSNWVDSPSRSTVRALRPIGSDPPPSDRLRGQIGVGSGPVGMHLASRGDGDMRWGNRRAQAQHR